MSKQPIKVAVLGAAFNTPNMGVSVLAAGALRSVLHAFPNARIIQLDYGREGFEFHFPFAGNNATIRFVNMRFSKRLLLPNNIGMLLLLVILSKLLPSKKLRERLFSANACLNEIIETDLFLSLAGGDSFSDIYGLKRLVYTSLPQILVLLAGKRLILLPQTIGPFRRRISRVIAKYILARAELVYARDRTGQSATRSLMGLKHAHKKLKFCYDLGFDVDPVSPTVSDIAGLPALENLQSEVVGLNISGLLMMGGYSQKNMFGLKVAYDGLIFKLIEFLIEKKSAAILLIPHVLGNAAESDSSACEAAFEKLRSKYEGRIGVLRTAAEYGEIKHWIGRCDFFIGARMHACIGALSQHVPAVSIAYSDKFIGVMESIGFANLVADPRKMDEQQILQLVDDIFSQRRSVRRALEEKMPVVKQTIRDLFHEPAGLLEPKMAQNAAAR